MVDVPPAAPPDRLKQMILSIVQIEMTDFVILPTGMVNGKHGNPLAENRGAQ
jgi:hypothetical protein